MPLPAGPEVGFEGMKAGETATTLQLPGWATVGRKLPSTSVVVLVIAVRFSFRSRNNTTSTSGKVLPSAVTRPVIDAGAVEALCANARLEQQSGIKITNAARVKRCM
jgi:hypothetical protein